MASYPTQAYVFLGWIIGAGPPCHFLDALNAGRVLSTMLKAHAEVYRALKAMPGGSEAQIGFVTHHIRFEAAGQGPLYAHSRCNKGLCTTLSPLCGLLACAIAAP